MRIAMMCGQVQGRREVGAVRAIVDGEGWYKTQSNRQTGRCQGRRIILVQGYQRRRNSGRVRQTHRQRSVASPKRGRDLLAIFFLDPTNPISCLDVHRRVVSIHLDCS